MIKKADKGETIVIMDREDYIAEAVSTRHLNNPMSYRHVDQAPTVVLASTVANTIQFVDHLYVTCPTLPKEFKASLVQREPKLGEFDLLPKIHKKDKDYSAFPLKCPCRLICGMPAHPCKSLSKFVHYLLKPALCKACPPEVVVDTWGVIRLIDNTRI